MKTLIFDKLYYFLYGDDQTPVTAILYKKPVDGKGINVMMYSGKKPKDMTGKLQLADILQKSQEITEAEFNETTKKTKKLDK